MKAIKFSILAVLMVLLAGCQEEIWPNGHVEEGIPTSLDFSVSVPAAEEVTVTRASVADYESEIKELMLIMFEESGRKMVVDVTPYLGNGAGSNIAEGHRVYTLTSPIEKDMYGGPVLSGTYKVYAVANWSGSFAGLSNLDQLSEEELVGQIAQNTGFVYSISGAERFPMSSITKNVTIAPEGSSLSLKLKRLTSRIEFTFQNGSSTNKDGEAENPNFTPTSYTIYNIPGKANFFSKGDNKITNGTFDKSEPISLTSKEFEFFMLENVQTAKQPGCDSQKEREHWTGGNTNSTTAPEDKNFVYAPDNGTFIVVSGTYNGASYIGDVSYTIHLGNFSEGTNTANGKDFSNFKVNRNEKQTYKVTVNGVESIFTEVTTNDEVHPGVEGSLAEKAENTFVLDAHYEKVMMDLTGLGESAYLFVDTPYCQDNNGHAQVKLSEVTKADLDEKGIDYKWVSFIKPSSATDFPVYNKANCGDIHDLVNDIVAGTAKYYTEIDGKKLTAAFVDEYFYETKPDGSAAKWTEFANTDNRTMSIRPGISYSPDGNSSLVQNSHIELSQRSIKTTYAFDGKDPNDGVYVPFGIETWDETGAVKFHRTQSWWGGTSDDNGYNPSGLTNSDGWNNTKILTSGQLPMNYTKAGYLSSVTDNSKENHVYGEYVKLSQDERAQGFNACLLRNRDEDGNGSISDSELKWYLPAIDQYISIWLSEDQLHEDTQLFDRANLDAVSDNLNRSSVYYSSSDADKRLYWALEGASFGAYGSSYANATNNIRCVRNMVATSDHLYSGIPSQLALNEDTRIISVNNITAVRQIDHVGEYGKEHTERSSDNLLPKAFEVAKVYLGENITATDGTIIPTGNGTGSKDSYGTKNSFIDITDACASGYYQESDKSDLGLWRVPNQRELMLMLMFDESSYVLASTSEVCTSSTYLINHSNSFKPLPFATYKSGISLDTQSARIYIRCVRDAQVIAPTPPTPGGDPEQGSDEGGDA